MSGIDVPPTSALAGWLARAMQADRVRIGRYERLSGGAIQGNFALDIDVAGGAYAGHHALVLRSDAPSGVAASLSRAQEFAVLRAVHAAGVLAPQPLFHCGDRDVIGREFFVMRRIAGVAAGRRLAGDASLVPDGAALARELGANLARIHALVPPLPILDVLPPPARDPARAAIAQYRGYLDTMDETHPALEWGLRWCEIHAPGAAGITLLHRDYRSGNYLVDRGHLAAVLDWEFAGWGDPREDLGWFTARCWRFGAVDREAGGIASVEPFLEGYESVAARRISRGDLDYWQVMAHLRWAVIALQQARRHLVHGETSLELALTGRIVHELEHEIVHLTGGLHR
jgi:aminoglycoside phosphotransferase (APT) family kinase protein